MANSRMKDYFDLWMLLRDGDLDDAQLVRAIQATFIQISASRTLRAYLNGIYTQHQSRKKNGGRGTLDMIQGNFSDLLDRDMATISAADIKVWQSRREKEGLAHVTLQRAYGALRTLLRHAVVEQILDSNPIAGVSLSAPTAAEKSRSLREENCCRCGENRQGGGSHREAVWGRFRESAD